MPSSKPHSEAAPVLRLRRRETTGRGREVPPGTGVMGMAIFLVSLTALFAASLVGYFWTRANATVWPPPGMPALPASLWVSTALLVASSVTVHLAWLAARRSDRGALQRGLAGTLLLALLFLAVQSYSWWALWRAGIPMDRDLYAWLFYLLTGLHAVHVLGGLLPLGFVSRRAFAGRYSAAHHPGVTYCAMYWHFLDLVWVVIFVTLLTTT